MQRYFVDIDTQSRTRDRRLKPLDITPVSGPTETIGYLQSTFLGLGGVAVLVIGNDVPRYRFNVGRLPEYAARIWPVGDAFQWPRGKVIDDATAQAVANILNEMTYRPR